MKQQVRSILYMFLITLFFASLVSAVKELNDKRIESNQILKLQRVIFRVIDIDTDDSLSPEDISTLFDRRIKTIQVKERTVYIGYEEDLHTVRGYALPVGGPGFWGPIEGMVGISPDASRVLGVAFYRHMETPGLGGRITQDWFTGQFRDLALYPIEGEKNIFYLTPESSQKKTNELDAITGATNTSRAVEAFLNQDLDNFLREIWSTIGEKN